MVLISYTILRPVFWRKKFMSILQNGDVKMLPVGSTALDFAFSIHSAIGVKTIGAKVNHKLVPISHKLQSGDQVEIITSNKQKPSEDWLNLVVTAKAKK